MKIVKLSVLLVFSLVFHFAVAIERVSVSPTGEQGNADSGEFPFHNDRFISGSGRFVVFASSATNLTENDVNGYTDIFVKDTLNNTVELISVSSGGQQSNADSELLSITKNGRYVSFLSKASNLVAHDGNNTTDMFIHDRQTGITDLVSIFSNGLDAYNGPYARKAGQFITSDNGRFIAFSSHKKNLVENDHNNSVDVFVLDRETNGIEIVSIRSNGEQRVGNSGSPSISADGRYIAFDSMAALVPGDTPAGVSNGDIPFWDIFLHDRVTRQTKRITNNDKHHFNPSLSANAEHIVFEESASNDLVKYHNVSTGLTEIISKPATGSATNHDSNKPSVSENGRYVVFNSRATNLVYGDTNRGSSATSDTFVTDRLTGVTKLVSITDSEIQANKSTLGYISANGKNIVLESFASNLTADDTNQASDVFVKKNPFEFSINLVGAPIVDKSNESGVFVWQNNVGRFFLKVVAGDQNTVMSAFRGSILAEELINSLTAIALEPADTLSQLDSARIDFDLKITAPDKDVFSFLVHESQSLCLLLNEFTGGLYLGPDKIKVTQPYDITNQSACDARTVPLLTSPDIDKSNDSGIFIWKVTDQVYKSAVVSGQEFKLIDINMQKVNYGYPGLSNFTKIGFEPNDQLNIGNEIDILLRIAPGSKDGFKFKVNLPDNLCMTTTSVLPIYAGPLRAQLGNGINLGTLKPCRKN